MAKFHDNDDLEDGKWIEWSEGISGWSVQPCAINCATCVHNILLLVCLQCVFKIFYCWCVKDVCSKYFTAGVFTMCVQNIFWCVYNIFLHALYNIFHDFIHNSYTMFFQFTCTQQGKYCLMYLCLCVLNKLPYTVRSSICGSNLQ